MSRRILLFAALGLILAGCSPSPAETSTPQDEAALKSGSGVQPPAGFKSPGSEPPTGR